MKQVLSVFLINVFFISSSIPYARNVQASETQRSYKHSFKLTQNENTAPVCPCCEHLLEDQDQTIACKHDHLPIHLKCLYSGARAPVCEVLGCGEPLEFDLGNIQIKNQQGGQETLDEMKEIAEKVSGYLAKAKQLEQTLETLDPDSEPYANLQNLIQTEKIKAVQLFEKYLEKGKDIQVLVYGKAFRFFKKNTFTRSVAFFPAIFLSLFAGVVIYVDRVYSPPLLSLYILGAAVFAGFAFFFFYIELSRTSEVVETKHADKIEGSFEEVLRNLIKTDMRALQIETAPNLTSPKTKGLKATKLP